MARFGLMHMIGTNLCIWLNVLVQETKHEIINLKLGHGQHHGGGKKVTIVCSVLKDLGVIRHHCSHIHSFFQKIDFM